MGNCTVYIDEAGDLGIQRGTTWFVLTAVIVNKEDESQIRTKFAQIKTRLNIKNIHLREIQDFNKRAYIVREIEDQEFTFVNVIADTSEFDRAKIGSSAIAYNYLCRLLLERVSWLLRDTGRTGKIILSARGTSRDGELIKYIDEKLIPYPNNQIAKNVFEKVEAKPAGSWDLLQLADICATSVFLAYEINGWGFRLPCFATVLSSHLYKHNNRLDSYGIKYFSPNMKPSEEIYNCSKACSIKERTPSATTT